MWKYFREKKNEKNLNEDQILLNLYQLVMASKHREHTYDVKTIRPNPKNNKAIQESTLGSLSRLLSKNMVIQKDSINWTISPEGKSYIEKYYKEGEE